MTVSRFGSVFVSASVLGLASAVGAQSVRVDSTHLVGTITLVRTGCYGTCPAYTVVLDHSGRITFSYRGSGNMRPPPGAAQPGETKVAQVDSIAIQRLAELIRREGFFELTHDLVSGAPECPGVISDAPTMTVTVANGDSAHHIAYTFGCGLQKVRDSITHFIPPSAGQLIQKIAAQIDSVANVKKWLGR